MRGVLDREREWKIGENQWTLVNRGRRVRTVQGARQHSQLRRDES